MWKLLRNMLLLTAAMAAALWLLLWVAAQQQAASIAAQLAPWAELRFGSAGASLDGVLSLRDVEVRLKQGPWREPVKADALRVRGGGPLWLLARAISRGDSVPSRLSLEVTALQLPAAFQRATAGWIGAKSGVPFDGLGCGPGLVDSDYAAMQRVARPLRLNVALTREDDARELSLDVRLDDAPFAEMRLRVEAKPFDYAMLADAKALKALRIGSVTLDYRDLGYFAARNRYCAQRMGWSIEQYLDRHLATLTGFLTENEIELGAEPLALYRGLLEHGGDVQVLSLPNANVSPIDYRDYDRTEVLRFLNLTARRDEAPPVLFKLSFLATPTDESAGASLVVTPPAPAGAAAATTTTAAGAPAKPSTPTASPGVPTTAAASPSPTPTPAAAAPAAAAASKALPAPGPATAVTTTAAVKPTPAAPPPSPPASAAAAAPPRPSPANTAVLRDPATGRPLPSSTPAPGDDSTLALVWKGATLERLPQATPAEAPYDVVPLDALTSRIGERVTIVTSGGKDIEGTVVALDAEGVVLRVLRETGSAELALPRQRVREVRIPRPRRD